MATAETNINILRVPAGRSYRRSPTEKWVDANPDKGAIEIFTRDDLLHLSWVNRSSGTMEDDLIIFPGEATFNKMQGDPSGRHCILKFSSSEQNYMYWFQELSNVNDLRNEIDINALINDQSYQPGTAPLPTRPVSPPATQEDRSHPPTPGAPKLSHPVPGPPLGSSSGSSAPATAASGSDGVSSEDMARVLTEWAQAGGLASLQAQEDAHLTDVLSPANLTDLLSSNPALISALTYRMPSGLNLPPNPTASGLMPILTAPQFTDAIASLDNALRSGGLPGGMMRELGLPAEAGTGVKQFLDALKGLEGLVDNSDTRGSPEQEDSRMEQD